MNLYEVLTEQVTHGGGYNSMEPPETWCGWGLVVADTPARAKRAVLISENMWEADIRDLPKCRVRKLASDVVSRPGIVTESEWPYIHLPEARAGLYAEYTELEEPKWT